MIVGRARIADFGSVIYAVHLSLARLRATAWFEHVESSANCADGGSRVGHACPVARHLGIALREHQFPAWPQDVMRATPEVFCSRPLQQFKTMNAITRQT